MATFADFERLDIRVGRVVDVENFPEARNPERTVGLGARLY